MLRSIVRVLVLGAQPTDAPPTRLEEELRRIERVPGVQVVPIWHTTFSDVAEQIATVRPHVVQFSGHGTREGRLVFEAGDGQHEVVPMEAIKLLCERDAARRLVRGVLLNACFSLPLAEQLVKSFDFAIGTPHMIANPAAVRFPAAFYAALARGEHLLDAARAGEAEFAVKQPESRPQLRCAAGIDRRGYRLQLSVPERPLLYIHHCPEEKSDRDMLAELRTQLHPLESRIEIWDRSQIAGGESRSEAITRNLERASLILCLVSAAALADNEWVAIKNRACERKQARLARIYPLLLRACLFTPEEFGGVDPINRNNRLIAGLSEAQRAESWVAVVQRLKREAAELQDLLDAERGEEQELNLRLARAPRPATPEAGTPPPAPEAAAAATTAAVATTAAAAVNDIAKVPTRPSLRRLLEAAFPTAQDLQVFCADYFDKDTRSHLPANPSKVELINVLLDYVGPRGILTRLAAEERARMAPHLNLLRYE